jgi:hypothetical protein
MWLRIALFALLACAVPLEASAQPALSQDGGPPADVQQKMDAARNSARDASLAALSDDHRAKVQAVVDQFDAAGSTTTVGDASKAIDAVLDKNESAAVLAQQQKMRAAMRAAFSADSGGPGGGMGPGGFGGRGGRGGFGRGGGNRAPDAGRFLLSVTASQDRYRAAMEAERGSSGGPPPPQ